MSEITRIEIHNFQSHARTVIEPAPAGGLTVITGPSDNGKSAIVRALKWLYYNDQPQGDDFCRAGCDFVEANIETTSDRHVTRRRTSSTNRYIVDGKKYEGFRYSVPIEVQQATSVRPVRLDNDNIQANIAGQLEAPFLGNSISAPARAKALGKLAGAEVIDQANRDLGTDLHRAKQEVKRLEAEVEKLEQQAAQYDYLPALADRLEQLKQLDEQIRTAQERMRQLTPYRQRLQGLGDQKSSLLAVLNSLGNPEKAAIKWTEAEHNVARRRQLARLMNQSAEVNQQTKVLQASIAAIGDPEQAASRLERAQSAHSMSSRLFPLATSLRVLHHTITEAHETVNSASGTEAALTNWQTAAVSANRLNQLQRLNGTLGQTTEQYRLLSDQLDTSSEIASLKVPASELNLLNQLKAISIRLSDTKQAYNSAMGTHGLATQTLEKATELYKNTLLEAGRCPLCGSEIQDDCIKEVLSA